MEGPKVHNFIRLRSRDLGTSLDGGSLSRQFFFVAAIVLGVAMLVLGTLVSSLVQQSVLRTAGDEWAAFLGAFLEPHIQDLRPGEALTPEQGASLDAMFSDGRLGETLVAIKIWSVDGHLLYSTGRMQVGEPGPTGSNHHSADVQAAAEGRNVVQLDEPSAEDGRSGAAGPPLVEVYAPLHHLQTRDVIAVGELYEDASNLVLELDRNRLTTWLAVVVTTILMTGSLYLIVRRAAGTIARQRQDLKARVEEAGQLAAQNNELRLAAEKARLDASEANEQLLGRIGADLHDGPVQLLSLVALRLSAADPGTPAGQAAAPDVVNVLKDALGELRNISAGLSLPEIGMIGLRQTLELAVFRHEDLTGTRVKSSWGELPPDASDAVKTCAYRVIQEGLSNAYKHAHGADIEVSGMLDGGFLRIEVTDTGSARQHAAQADGAHQKLGLAGMRNRVTSLDGTLEVTALEPQGTRISVRIPLDPSAQLA